MQSREVADAIYQMARIGLIEITKDTRNGPAAVAQHASILEMWRVGVDNQLKEADKVAAESKVKTEKGEP